MARSIEHDPLMTFRFHAQWGTTLSNLQDLTLSKASFITVGGITGRGNLILRRALYGGKKDAMLRFLSTDKEVRLLLHVGHITSGFDERTGRWTNSPLTIEFSGVIPSAAIYQRRVELDASKSGVLEMEVMVHFTKMRFIHGNREELAQTDAINDWVI